MQQIDGERIIQVGQRLTNYGDVDVIVQRVIVGERNIIAIGPCQVQKKMRVLKTFRSTHTPGLEWFFSEAILWVGMWLHPNILPAYYLTRINGIHFLVLEYADNGSLRDMLTQHTRLPLDVALPAVQGIATGLTALHTPDPLYLRPFPIIHRDIKPENLLVRSFGPNQGIQLADFGLAISLEGLLPQAEKDLAEQHMTLPAFQRALIQPGKPSGTTAYISPEQWDATSEPSPAIDMYALGIVLYELLTGAKPIVPRVPRRQNVPREAFLEIWHQAHRTIKPPSLRAAHPNIPVALEEIYQALVAKKPRDRPTAGEALAALQDVSKSNNLPVYIPQAIPHSVRQDMNFWTQWAATCNELGFHDEALQRSEYAVRLARQNPTASSYIPGMFSIHGDILTSLGRYVEAMDTYQEAFRFIAPEDSRRHAMIHHQIGFLYHTSGRYADAEEAYMKALSFEALQDVITISRANNERLWAMSEIEAGNLLDAREHVTRGIAYTEQSLEMSPHHVKYQQSLEQLRELQLKLNDI